MKPPESVSESIQQWKAVMKDVRADQSLPEDYRDKLLSNARQYIATLRKLEDQDPPKRQAMVAAVLNSLSLSLRNHADIDPRVLRAAADRVVKLFDAGNQQRKAAHALHDKTSRPKVEALRNIWRNSTKAEYATKTQCVEAAEQLVGLKIDAAKSALKNVSRKKVSARR